MEISQTFPLPYIIERATDTSVLSNFYCGIEQMDSFIHRRDGLRLYVESNLTNLWLLYEKEIVVGFFALSKSSLILNSIDLGNIHDESSSNLHSLFDHIESFPAVKIDYIAIRKEYQKTGIGSGLLWMIRERVINDILSSTLFITVDAFDTHSYSSVGFYKKNFFRESEYGLVQNQNKSREGKMVDTKLMYLPLLK